MTIETTSLREQEISAQPAMKVAVTSAKAPDFVEGRRNFFQYRDLGVTAASNGWMRAQVRSTVTGMTKPTGWHYHVCEGQFVYALKGWVELEFEDGTNCRLETGDSCFIPGGMHHNEIRTSDDLNIWRAIQSHKPGWLGSKLYSPAIEILEAEVNSSKQPIC